MLAQFGRLAGGRGDEFQRARVRHRQRLLVMHSGLFDHSWFRARYPELDADDPLDYFLDHGAEQHLSPGPFFNSQEYARSLGLPHDVNPLLHYLESRPG